MLVNCGQRGRQANRVPSVCELRLRVENWRPQSTDRVLPVRRVVRHFSDSYGVRRRGLQSKTAAVSRLPIMAPVGDVVRKARRVVPFKFF